MSLSPLEEKVLAAVDAERSAHEEYLRGLIRLKSHTGMEGPGQRDILRKPTRFEARRRVEKSDRQSKFVRRTGADGARSCSRAPGLVLGKSRP